MKSRGIAVCLHVIFIFLLLISPAKSAPGDLDISFGNQGKSIVSFSAQNDYINDIALQNDGKIVVVGGINFQPGAGHNFGVARFNSDGTLDTSFGNGGSVTTSFTGSSAWAESVVIQPDGKIVVCGRSGSAESEIMVLARYLADGKLDDSFSLDGKVETPFGIYATANAVALQPDGKIVVTGSTQREIAVVRYTSDGYPDRTFGHRGRVITSLSAESDQGWGIKVQPDGKIVVAGSAEVPVPPGPNRSVFVVVRYSKNGKVDATFDNDGIQTTVFGPRALASDFVLQPDGKILVAGYSSNGPTDPTFFALARYNANGSPDTSFDGDGKVTTETGGNGGVAFDLLVQPDGKIVAGGETRDAMAPGYSDFLLIRYNADGSPDGGFGVGGNVRTAMSTKWDEIRAVSLQSDGKIIAGGVATDSFELSDFALARYLAN